LSRAIQSIEALVYQNAVKSVLSMPYFPIRFHKFEYEYKSKVILFCIYYVDSMWFHMYPFIRLMGCDRRGEAVKCYSQKSVNLTVEKAKSIVKLNHLTKKPSKPVCNMRFMLGGIYPNWDWPITSNRICFEE